MTAVGHLLAESKNLETVSQKTGISVKRLNEIIQGGEPSLKEARLIARAFNVDLAALQDHRENDSLSRALFRRTIKQRNGDSAELIYMDKILGSASDLNEEKNSHYAQWVRFFDKEDNSYIGAEKNSIRFRELFFHGDHLSPMFNLAKILEEKLDISIFIINGNSFDGASAIFEGRPFIFLAPRFQGRMLFTLAHELGHIIAHHSSKEELAIIDRDMESENFSSDSNEYISEDYANAFASSLLLPREGLGVTIKTIQGELNLSGDIISDVELLYISRIYGVSFWAAAKRCEDLTLIPKGGAATLNEYLSKKYGSAEKRAEQLGLPGRPDINIPSFPTYFLEKTIRNIHTGELSIGRAAEQLGISIKEIMEFNRQTIH